MNAPLGCVWEYEVVRIKDESNLNVFSVDSRLSKQFKNIKKFALIKKMKSIILFLTVLIAVMAVIADDDETTIDAKEDGELGATLSKEVS